MLINTLKRLQGNLTDQEFANKLGIRRGSWSRIKNRRVPISDKFLVRVYKAFPELDIFNLPTVTTKDISVTESLSKPPQTHCSGYQRVLRVLVRKFTLGLPFFKSSKANQSPKRKSEGDK